MTICFNCQGQSKICECEVFQVALEGALKFLKVWKEGFYIIYIIAIYLNCCSIFAFVGNVFILVIIREFNSVSYYWRTVRLLKARPQLFKGWISLSTG